MADVDVFSACRCHCLACGVDFDYGGVPLEERVHRVIDGVDCWWCSDYCEGRSPLVGAQPDG